MIKRNCRKTDFRFEVIKKAKNKKWSSFGKDPNLFFLIVKYEFPFDKHIKMFTEIKYYKSAFIF